MKKTALLWIAVIAAFFYISATSVYADTPVVGPGPAAVIVPASNPGIYYHIGALNLTIPWDNVNVVYLYDLQGKRNLVGGEAVIASLWKLQGTVGAVTSLDGQGAPFIGGNLWFDNPIPQLAILNTVKPGIFGGYDWNARSAMFGFKAAIALF